MGKNEELRGLGPHEYIQDGRVVTRPPRQRVQSEKELKDKALRNNYAVKDSGERMQFDSGMVRDTASGKIDYWRVFVGPMMERLAVHVTKGAVKYPDVTPGVPNWTLAAGDAESERFRQSAARHFYQWMKGDTDEDHAAAVIFNINGYEYVEEKQEAAFIAELEADKNPAREIPARSVARERADGTGIYDLVQVGGRVVPLMTPEEILRRIKQIERPEQEEC